MHETARHAVDVMKESGAFSWITYWWVLVLSFFGGVVRVIKEYKLGDKTWKQIAIIFVCEMIVSGFVGVNTFFLSFSSGLRLEYCVVLTSIASYMGGRALTGMEAIYKAWLSAQTCKGK